MIRSPPHLMTALRLFGFWAITLALAWVHGRAFSSDGVVTQMVRSRPAWADYSWHLVNQGIPEILYFGSGVGVVLFLYRLSGLKAAAARPVSWRPVVAASVVVNAVVTAYLVEHREPWQSLYLQVFVFVGPFVWLALHELALWWQIGTHRGSGTTPLRLALRAGGHGSLVWVARLCFVLTSTTALGLRGENALGAVFPVVAVAGEVLLGIVVVAAGWTWTNGSRPRVQPRALPDGSR